MDKKLKRLQKILSVQKQLERMAEMDLAYIKQARNSIETAMGDTMDAMNSLSPVHRVFSPQYSKQLKIMQSKDQRLKGQGQVVEKRVLSERAKADRIEQNFEKVQELHDRHVEDEAIYDLLDLAQASGKFQKP